MVRYYGHYSNVSRGKRKKQDQDRLIPSILEPVEDPDFSGDGSSKEHRKIWARLIRLRRIDPKNYLGREKFTLPFWVHAGRGSAIEKGLRFRGRRERPFEECFQGCLH